MASSERRREPRIQERITFALHDAGTEWSAETKNLSASGAYCTLDHFIAPMTKLQLRFELPSTSTRAAQIRCTGVVVRVTPVISNSERGQFHMAILFTDLTDHDRTAIGRFVGERVSTQRT